MLTVESLNFHHLRYFWCVVREGGILPASRKLRVSHPTISAQLRELEGQLGVSLFHRSGRRLELTEVGHAVFARAEALFETARDLLDVVRTGDGAPPFRVGVTDDIPKLLVRQLLAPLLRLPERPRLVLEEERQVTLLARLGVRELDLVLADAETPSHLGWATVDHPLGGCGLSFLAASELAENLREGFPSTLDGAPLLAPPHESRSGQVLAQWLRTEALQPKIMAEVADSALMKTLGTDGLGVFAMPRVVELQVMDSYAVELVGRVDSVQLRFFGITAGPLRPETSRPARWSQMMLDRGRVLLGQASAHVTRVPKALNP